MMEICSKMTPGVWKEARKATWRLRMRIASFTNRLGKPSAKRLRGRGAGAGGGERQARGAQLAAAAAAKRRFGCAFRQYPFLGAPPRLLLSAALGTCPLPQTAASAARPCGCAPGRLPLLRPLRRHGAAAAARA